MSPETVDTGKEGMEKESRMREEWDFAKADRTMMY
jgi:hypothetical protein